MNANRLVEEWRRQGRILEVEGAGRDRYLCSWGSHFWLSLSKASTGIGLPRA
jgi:hypothetical protein